MNVNEISSPFWIGFMTENQSCQTPDQKAGSCILLRQCPQLNSILSKRPISNDDRSFLLQSQCGRRDRSPLVI